MVKIVKFKKKENLASNNSTLLTKLEVAELNSAVVEDIIDLYGEQVVKLEIRK